MQEALERWVQSLGQEDPLEVDIETHIEFLPGESHTEEPGRLWSIGSQRIEHDQCDLAQSTSLSPYPLICSLFLYVW